MDNTLHEPAGSAGLKSYYKAFRKALRVGRKVMASTEHPEVLRLLGAMVEGQEKACRVLRKGHAKIYQDHPLDDDELLDKALDEEEALDKEEVLSEAVDEAEPESDDALPRSIRRKDYDEEDWQDPDAVVEDVDDDTIERLDERELDKKLQAMRKAYQALKRSRR